MNFTIDLKTIPAVLRAKLRPLLQHLTLLIFVLLLGYLIAGVYQVNQILGQPTDQAYLTEEQKNSVRTRFDAQTIQRIEQLKSREENASLEVPGGQRVNPFVE